MNKRILIRSQAGFTMAELMVAAVISIIGMGIAFFMIQNTARQQLQAERASKRAQAVSIFERQVGTLTTSMNEAMMNPMQSLLWDGTNHVAVGSQWNRADGAIPEANVPRISVAGFSAPMSSHLFADYRLSVASSGSVNREVKNLLVSRCIDGRQPVTNLTNINEVMALRAPIVRNNKIFCCEATATSINLSACSDEIYYWPSTFLLKSNGEVDRTPADSDRAGVPGMGFVISFDANPPRTFYIHYLYMINRCVSGAAIRSDKCSNTSPGPKVEPNQAKLAKELKIDIKRVSSPIASDITGGSFIKLGPKSIEVK